MKRPVFSTTVLALVIGCLMLSGCGQSEEQALWDRIAELPRDETRVFKADVCDFALSQLSELLALDGEHFEARELRARTYLARGEFAPAADDLQKCLEQQPDNLELHRLRAETLTRNWSFDQAIQQWQAIVVLDGESCEAYLSLARCQLSALKYADAMKTLAEAPANCDSESAKILSASCHAKLGQHQQAVKLFSQIIAANPECAAAYWQRADSWVALGDEQMAVEDRRLAKIYNPALARNGDARIGEITGTGGTPTSLGEGSTRVPQLPSIGSEGSP
ncbi:MAG: tetratricopeptide repeat protein [Planctomycetales bacterium]|nr:tetratricopeptide repeat protein [Planctomycetales bacterium]